ncbi:hypothetical protein, partial [Nocardiopsis sp. TNDT3]|uniref:hypothetical protein n=1 Tax=Nocardiopsis sp. TNDT3 TaxID=2249354 RepID=UPI001E33F301
GKRVRGPVSAPDPFLVPVKNLRRKGGGSFLEKEKKKRKTRSRGYAAPSSQVSLLKAARRVAAGGDVA